MKKLWLFGLSLCSILLAGCNNGDEGLVDVPNGGIHQAVSIVVTPKNAQIPVGLPLQFEAVATLDDGTTVDVTSNPSLSWSSSNNDIATIDSQGLLASVSTGQVTITAKGINKDGSIVVDTSDVTVTNATVTELLVTPKKPSVAKGLNQAFKAEAIMSDGQVIDVTKNSELTWSSSDTEVASISDDGTNKGQALGLAVGTSEIKAQGMVGDTEFSDTAVLTVNEATIQSFNVSPDVVSIPVGLDSVLKAEVTLTDGSVKNVTQEANWATTDPTVLDVNNTEGNKGSIHAKKTSTSPVDVT
ncbi:TPA: Ig-like domain-containing protein, partial [Vibrio parahaemolyticus]